MLHAGCSFRSDKRVETSGRDASRIRFCAILPARQLSRILSERSFVMASNSSRSYETIVLPRWLRWTLYATTAVLFATGALWLAVHFGLKQGGADDLPHPAEPWILRVHGLAMMVGLFIYGSLLRAHMVNAWNLRRNRNTGLLVASMLALVTITGYMLYYVGGETTRPIISIVHWAIGLVIGGLLPFHVWHGRRARNAPD